MRVLHLVNSMGLGNGITNVVVDLSIQQRADGDKVCVASRRGQSSDLIETHGVETAFIDFTYRSIKSLIRARKDLAALIGEFHPDIVHAHTITPLLIFRSLFTGIPVVATVHNEWQRASILMKHATLAVGVSASVTESMVRKGIPRARMRTVANGTTGSVRRPMKVIPIELTHPAVLFAGGLSYRKGIDILVEAFSRLRASGFLAHLYLVGNNDYPVTQESLQDRGIVDDVTLVGVADPYPYYAAADIFVLPSRAEPAGLVLLEAAAMGVPLLGSRVGGIAEFLDGEGGGVTVPSANPTALARQLRDCLGDVSRLRRMRVQALGLAARHTVRDLADGYRRVYTELL